MPDATHCQEANSVRIEPLTAAIGAELSDIDLGGLDAETASELRKALLEYKVVGIRDQFLMTRAMFDLPSRSVSLGSTRWTAWPASIRLSRRSCGSRAITNC